MSNKIKMKLVDKPVEGTASVITKTTPGPIMKGIDDDKLNVDYLCGMCKSIVYENVPFGFSQNIIIQCPKCKRYNQG